MAHVNAAFVMQLRDAVTWECTAKEDAFSISMIIVEVLSSTL